MIGLYWKAAAAVLIGLILSMTLEARAKEMKILLILGVCAMVAVNLLEFLEPVMDFFCEVGALVSLDGGIFKSLLQLTGIGLIGEIGNLVCADAGCSSLGKGLGMLSAGAILWLSLPVFRAMTELIQDILGAL